MTNTTLFVSRHGKTGHINFADGSKSETFEAKGAGFTLLLQLQKEGKISQADFATLREELYDSNLTWEKGPEEKVSMSSIGSFAMGINIEKSHSVVSDLPKEEDYPVLFLCNDGALKQAVILYGDVLGGPIYHKEGLLRNLEGAKQKDYIDDAGFEKVKKEITESSLFDKSDEADVFIKSSNMFIIMGKDDCYIQLGRTSDKMRSVSSKRDAIKKAKGFRKEGLISGDEYDTIFNDIITASTYMLPWNHVGKRVISGSISMGMGGLGMFGGPFGLGGLFDLGDLLGGFSKGTREYNDGELPEKMTDVHFKMCDSNHGHIYFNGGMTGSIFSREHASSYLNGLLKEERVDQSQYDEVMTSVNESPLPETSEMYQPETAGS